MWKISPFDEWLNSEVVAVKREHVGVDIHSSASLTPTNSILSNKTTMFNTLSTFLALNVSTSAVLSVRLENQSLLFEEGLVSPLSCCVSQKLHVYMNKINIRAVCFCGIYRDCNFEHFKSFSFAYVKLFGPDRELHKRSERRHQTEHGI